MHSRSLQLFFSKVQLDSLPTDLLGLSSLFRFHPYSMARQRVEEFFTSTSRFAYDVFLSFRGKETRKTFTDHLYIALLDAGFRTFRDEEGIEVGENIKTELWKAIQDSRISIVVFSKDYASSCWCLDELLMILKRRRASGHEVLPIFYNIDPTLIKKQKERYMEAFARHEEQFMGEVDERKVEWAEKLKEWWAAFEELADLGGMVSKIQDDGDESKFIQKVVIVVQDKISRTISSVSPYLIGMHARTEDINTWLQDESSGVGMAAICGMGGIGKTTIAKIVYNSNFSSFEGGSFLANVREISGKPRGLIRLQRKLLSDILRGRKEKVYSIDEGIVKIKAALYCKRVLVVLDDVDKVEQLDAILGMRDWFSRGSKIIITTRRERLLRAHETCRIYTVDKLDDAESLELFSWHAFGQDHPTDFYEACSRRMVHYCEGLPLAIKVLGSSLSGKSLDVWKSHLEKLKALPNREIFEKLKISYENLQDEHDKNLFLHIACFFVGKDRDWTVQILNECDFYATIGIQNLIDRCMLSIDFQNKLRMHQLIRDMGREIVRQESSDEPGKRSRIWNHDDSFDILAEETGTEKIEGLILDMQLLKGNEFRKTVIRVNRKRSSEELMETSMLFDQCNSPKRQRVSTISWNPVGVALRKIVFEINAFAKMCKLRLLQLNFVQLGGSFDKFPETLRWLSWHGFPFESIHNDLSLDTVVALDLRYSRLKNVWDGRKSFNALKILNLSHSHFLAKTPDFSLVPNLERLILKDCVNMAEIHESIGNLKALAVVILKDCRNLRMLPRNFIMLKSLEKLDISGCSNLDELPTGLRNMKSLKVFLADRIDASRLLSITGEPKSRYAFLWSLVQRFGRVPRLSESPLPSSLVRLSLENCNLSDDVFPKDFSHLKLLRDLNLGRNPIRSLPECIRVLSALHVLRLESCTELQSLLELPGLEILQVPECTSLEMITYKSGVSRPQIIDQTNCEKLVDIEDAIKLEPIGNVDAEVIKVLGLHNVESMTNVEMDFFDGISANGMRSGRTERLPIQGLHEAGIFNTFFPGGDIPDWFSNKSAGSTISFTVCSLPNCRFKSLNFCCVYALSNKEEICWPPPLFAKVCNRSKDLKWIYGPCGFVIPKAGEEVIWLSHWKLGNYLDAGDEVNVKVVVDVGFQVKECGINHVCVQDQEDIEKASFDHSRLDACIYGSIPRVSSVTINGATFLGNNISFSQGRYSTSYHFSRFDWSQELLEDSTEKTGQVIVQGGSEIFTLPTRVARKHTHPHHVQELEN